MAKQTSRAQPKRTDRPHEKTGQERNLDEALDATFPASDPVTVGHGTGDEPASASKDRRTPPLDTALVEKLARELKQTRKKG